MSGFPCPARLFLLGSTYTGGCGVLNGCPGCPSAKAPRAGGLGRAAAYAHAAAAQGERRKAPRGTLPGHGVESKEPPAFQLVVLGIRFRASPLRCFPCYQYSTVNSPKASKLFRVDYSARAAPPAVASWPCIPPAVSGCACSPGSYPGRRCSS